MTTKFEMTPQLTEALSEWEASNPPVSDRNYKLLKALREARGTEPWFLKGKIPPPGAAVDFDTDQSLMSTYPGSAKAILPRWSTSLYGSRGDSVAWVKAASREQALHIFNALVQATHRALEEW